MKVLFLHSASATSKDMLNGTATWHLLEPIRFDHASIACHEFSFTNFFMNVSAAQGNNTIYYSNDAATPTKYNVVIPDGSYNVETFDSVLSAAQQASVGSIIFNVLPNQSTNKCYLTFNSAGWYVTFQADHVVTGFIAGNYPANKVSTAHQVVYATNTASFNGVEQINVSCNLTNDSVSNTMRSSVIHTCTPSTQVSAVENSKHYNLIWLDAPMLANQTSEITISLTDQNANPIMMYENFSVTLLIN